MIYLLIGFPLIMMLILIAKVKRRTRMSRFLKALGNFIFSIAIFFIGTFLLSYLNIHITNRLADKISSLNIINVYSDNGLNGLLTVGIILAVISFIYDMFFKKGNQKNDKKIKRVEKGHDFKIRAHV